MKKHFLGIGECMVELAQTGPQTYRRGFAGDTFNTSWYARRLLGQDWSVGYLSAIGTDAVSDEMRGFFASEGIETAGLRAVSDRTVGLYMISTEAGERSFSYWRSQSAARLLAQDAGHLENQLQEAGLIHFSGITLAILPPEDRRSLCAAIGKARAAGTLVSFDTNLRPRLWEDAATMRAGLTLGASVADVVLPSFDEDGALFEDATPQETIARYRAGGAGCVMVKNGGEPLTGWSAQEGEVTLETCQVARVVDSTAAGDSFAAALVTGLATGQGIVAAAQQANELAAKVIGSPGALVPDIFDEGETR
ncbi:MAG: sugar kinase [Sulfitobacter sp.]|nr:sugar kinase [Sulfitobacter sp.]